MAGDPERYPAARAKRESVKQRLVVAVAEREDRVLLFRRPDDSTLLAGTWELPWVREEESPPEVSTGEAVARTQRQRPGTKAPRVIEPPEQREDTRAVIVRR